MIDVLIVDDEAPARDELRYLLSRETGINVLAEVDNGPAAVAQATVLQPDVVFLDVEMRGMNGCETAMVLRLVSPKTLIVFATAYDDYAVRAFEIGAVDYLLKPFDSERVHSAVERLKSYRPEEWHQAAERIDRTLQREKLLVRKLPVERNGKIVLTGYDDILYIHTAGGLVTVVTPDGEQHFNGTLGELEERFAGTNLVRVHKSYIVNMAKVSEVIPWFKGTYWLKVENLPQVEIPVGKGQIKEIKEMLGLK